MYIHNKIYISDVYLAIFGTLKNNVNLFHTGLFKALESPEAQICKSLSLSLLVGKARECMCICVYINR